MGITDLKKKQSHRKLTDSIKKNLLIGVYRFRRKTERSGGIKQNFPGIVICKSKKKK
jgi:hypothetical protein